MKQYGKFLTIILGAAMSFILTAGVTFAAMDMNSMPSMGSTTPTAAAADLDAFKELWDKAYTAAAFTPEQTKRLVTELDDASKKLAENYKGLSDFLKQQKTAKGDAAKTIQKRIDLKEAERDLIISQTKLKLEEFLSKEQVMLISMAGFHNTSMSMTGEEHLKGMMEPMSPQMGSIEQMRMDLLKLAEKINQNCEAVTLELIRTVLSKITMSTM